MRLVFVDPYQLRVTSVSPSFPGFALTFGQTVALGHFPVVAGVLVVVVLGVPVAPPHLRVYHRRYASCPPYGLLGLDVLLVVALAKQ
jgi:hypothetical protein